MRLLPSLLLPAALIQAVCALAVPPAVVHNPAVPAHGVVRLELAEQWRVGGENDEENFFGLVTWAEEGPDGLVYVLDAQLCQVSVFDREGRLVRTLFRQGEGPGEINRPRDLVLLPDGTVGAVQEFPGNIVRVTSEGVPAPSIIPHSGDVTEGGFIGLASAEHRGGTFLVTGVESRPGERNGTQERTVYVATVREDGKLDRRIREKTVLWDFTNFTYDEAEYLPAFFWANAVGPDGRIYTAPARDSYRIDVFAPDGTLERVVERDYESWRRDEKDREWMRALFAGALRNVPFRWDLKLADTESDIHWLNRGLQVDDEGNLWVLPSRGTRHQPEGIMATFDVFTPDGVFDRQVQVPGEGHGEKDGVFLLGTGRVLLVKGFVDAMGAMFGGSGVAVEDEQAAPMELVCYRVVD